MKGSSTAIRVLIVDDHALLRRGLTASLAEIPDIEVVGEAGSGLEGIKFCRELAPDVVLMDLVMPEMDGVRVIEVLHAEFPDLPVLALTSVLDEELVQSALKAGASGYLVKSIGMDELANAIRTAHDGHVTLSADASRMLVAAVQRSLAQPVQGVSNPHSSELTAREHAVLALVVDGLSNAEIARRLQIGVGTVKTHISSILGKYGVQRRTELIALVVQGKISL